jgi:hypothetical protein
MRFNVLYFSAEYWRSEAFRMQDLYKRQKKVNELYIKYTGISAESERIMQQNFEIKDAICKDCVPKLEDCEDQLFRSKERVKSRTKLALFGIPIAAGIGFLAGAIYF